MTSLAVKQRTSPVVVLLMPRSNPQSVKLLQQLIRLGRERLSPRWMLWLGVGLVTYLLLQPVLERSLGWNLPGLSDIARESSPVPFEQAPSAMEPSRSVHGQSTGERSTTAALHRILQQGSHEVFVSPAGLHYTRGSQQGHRLKHLMRHARDEPERPGRHGVFDRSNPTEIVTLVDAAYRQALVGTHTDTRHEGQRTIYTVDLGRRIGYVGGQTGNRQKHSPASQLRLVIDRRNLITAFPIRP